MANLFTLAQQLQSNPSFFATVGDATEAMVQIFLSLKSNPLASSGRKLQSLPDDAVKLLVRGQPLWNTAPGWGSWGTLWPQDRLRDTNVFTQQLRTRVHCHKQAVTLLIYFSRSRCVLPTEGWTMGWCWHVRWRCFDADAWPSAGSPTSSHEHPHGDCDSSPLANPRDHSAARIQRTMAPGSFTPTTRLAGWRAGW